MSISRPCYVTREEVALALDVAETARSYDRIDRAIESASDDVDGTLRRTFSPVLDTRYFSWPDVAYRTPWRLWLDESELIRLDSLTAGGVTIPSTDWLLEPDSAGPPYWAIEVNRSTSSVFQAGTTFQRAIAATGLFGYRNDEDTVGTLAGTLDDAEGATASVTWSTPKVGVGSLLRIGTEYVLVTDRSMVNSGQTTGGALAKDTSAVSLAVQDGTAFAPDEVLLIDSERVRVTAVAGNTLTLKRSVDGSVLASHGSGAAIYALLGVTLKRAAQGSTLAEHAISSVIYRHLAPPLVRDLALAYALNQFLQEGAGYGRTIGTGENQQEASGRGVRSIEADAMVRHGRQQLLGAI